MLHQKKLQTLCNILLNLQMFRLTNKLSKKLNISDQVSLSIFPRKDRIDIPNYIERYIHICMYMYIQY